MTTLNCLTCRAVFRSSLKEREMAEKKLSPRAGLWTGGSGTVRRVQRAHANHQMPMEAMAARAARSS